MNEALQFLGLLNRGGALRFGGNLEASLNKAALLVLAKDASENTKKAYVKQGLPVLEAFSKEELGRALGFEEISAVAVLNRKAAKALLEKAEKKGEST